MLRSARASSLAWLLLVTVVVTLGWLSLHRRWTAAAWQSPGAGLGGDIIEVAARVRIAAEQGPALRNTFGRVDRLGAPFTADWSAYPTPDRLVFAVAGCLARHVGVFGAINAMILAGYLANACAFFAVARALRWRPEWSAAGAILYAFATFHYAWAGTLSLAWTCALPPLLLLVRVIAGRSRLPGWAGSRRAAVAGVIVGFWLGGGNPYHAFVAGQLLLGALLFQACRSRQPARLRLGGIALATLLFGFVLTHWAALLAPVELLGREGVLRRDYAGSELYALRPIELVVPPPHHRWSAWAEIGGDYAGRSLYRSGEPPAGYLGLAGLAGLLVILVAGLRPFLRPRGNPAPPDRLLLVGWIFALGCVGGVNAWLAFAGLDQFRASNRFAVFILAAALLALASWGHHRTRAHRAWSLVFAILVTAVGLLDQTPRPPPPASHESGAKVLAADAAAVAGLVAATTPAAWIFQLPAVPFPEVAAMGQFTDYEHLRLFLPASQLRFSHGGLRGSPSVRWSAWAARRDPKDLPMILARHGFSALVLDRRAYPEAESDKLVEAVQAGGATAIALPQSPHLAAFVLPAAGSTISPQPDDPRYFPAWDASAPADASLELQAASDWYPLEREGARSWRWAAQEATLGIWHGQPAAQALRLSASLTALSPGRVTVLADGRELWSSAVAPGSATPLELALAPVPGSQLLVFRFTGDIVRPAGDRRDLGFQLADVQVTRTP